jgi:hypothetical protein
VQNLKLKLQKYLVVEFYLFLAMLNTNVLGLEFVGILGCCRHSFIMFNTNVVGSKFAFASTFSSISRLLVNKVVVALASMILVGEQSGSGISLHGL